MAAAETPVQKKGALMTQVKSLNPDDDLRTTLSKLISWILRRGASQAGVRQDPNTKWVKWSDLCTAEVLKEHSSEFLWQVVVDYNGKKMRYEISDAPGGPFLRAYQNSEREAKGERVTNMQQPKHQRDKDVGQGEGDSEAASGQAQTYSPYLSMDPYAQLQAMTMMQWQIMSQYMSQVTGGVAAGRYYGWVKSVNFEKGFGFIVCPQTYAQFQRDVFVRGQDLQGLEQGQMVTFTLDKNKNGMPQARDVQASAEQGTPMPTKGKGKGGGHDGKGKDGKGKEGKGKDAKGKGKEKDKGKTKEGKKGKGKDGKGNASMAHRPTLEMPKTVIADLGALAPPKTVIADLGALAPPQTIIADLGALSPPQEIVADLGVE